MIDTVIFDMDGVLSDTEKSRFETLKKLLIQHNILLHEDDIKDMVGKKTGKFLEEKYSDKLSNEDIQKIVKKRKYYLMEYPKDYIFAFPYAKQIPRLLKDKDYTLILVSSAQRKVIDVTLDLFEITDCFDYIVSADDVNNFKPDPEPYLKALHLAKKDSKQALVIEDTPVGIESAKGAGIKVVGITQTRFKDELSKADIIIDSLDEIIEVIEDFNLLDY